jgi:hypothetical protein
MKDPLTEYELDRLEAARCNSMHHRIESPNKRLLQLAFEEIEYLRGDGRDRLQLVANDARAELARKKTVRRSALRQLITDVENAREMLRRPSRIMRPDETEEDLRP